MGPARSDSDLFILCRRVGTGVVGANSRAALSFFPSAWGQTQLRRPQEAPWRGLQPLHPHRFLPEGLSAKGALVSLAQQNS